MENEEEKDKSLKNLEEAMKEIDKMSTIDKYKFMFARVADEINYKKEKKKSDSFIKRLMDKFKTAEDTVIEEESNDKPKNDE